MSNKINKDIITEAHLDAKKIEEFAYSKASQELEKKFAVDLEKIVTESLAQLNKTEVNAIDTNIDDAKTEPETISEEVINSNTESELSDNTENIFEIVKLSEDDIQAQNQAPEQNQAPAQEAPVNEDPLANIQNQLDDFANTLSAIAAKMGVNPEGEANANPGTGAEGEVQIVDDGNADVAQPDQQQTPNNQNMNNQTPETANNAVNNQPAPGASIPDETMEQRSAISQEQRSATMEEENDDVMYEIDEAQLEEYLKELNVNPEADAIDAGELNDIPEIDIDAIMANNDTEEDIPVEELVIMPNEELETPELEMDEMRGVGHAVQHSAANRQNFMKNDFNHAPVGNMSTFNPMSLNQVTAALEEIKKAKTQYESKIDGLKKENESLKQSLNENLQTINEFEQSFIELRGQIHELRTWNGKLAMVNELYSKTGLTSQEKSRIIEEFNNASTIEEAKKVYGKFTKEITSKTNDISTEPQLKSLKPNVISSTPTPVENSKTVTLYESAKAKSEKDRNRVLIGIAKNEE